MTKPLILVSNDDGILSPNLEALAASLEAPGNADVLVVAPERERSAASHAITLHKPLRLKQVRENRFALSGTPVDCVYIGILNVADRRPSIVLSGINHGFNLGSDVFYSGTFAAAAEGGLRGIPAVALSLEPRGDIELATRFAAALVASALEAELVMPPRTVLNVNVPAAADGRYRWTILGERNYADDVNERHDPRGRPYYWIGGGGVGMGDVPGSDCNAIVEGVISVTPLHLDLTHRELAGAQPLWNIDGFPYTP